MLREDHYLILEHGDKQQQDVGMLLQQSGWRDIDCTTDLAGLARVSSARR